MLIIPKSPIEWEKHSSLGANTEAWDSFVILRVNKKFQLSLFKSVDTRTEKWYPIAVFDTRDQCEHLFKEIVTAIANGDKVFRVRDYL